MSAAYWLAAFGWAMVAVSTGLRADNNVDRAFVVLCAVLAAGYLVSAVRS